MAVYTFVIRVQYFNVCVGVVYRGHICILYLDGEDRRLIISSDYFYSVHKYKFVHAL